LATFGMVTSRPEGNRVSALAGLRRLRAVARGVNECQADDKKKPVLREAMEHDGEDGSDEDDVVPETASAGVDLPPATLKALATTGVPRELRLPDWAGPVLFHSELGSGRLVSTAAPDALVRRTGEHEGYILGSVRDAASHARGEAGGASAGAGAGGSIHSVFVLRKSVGDVLLLDISKPEDDRFVNSSLDAFLASMHAFVAGWAHFATDVSERGDAVIASFRALLSKLDARALASPEHYWPGWLDELD
jgi:hypothetical protein